MRGGAGGAIRESGAEGKRSREHAHVVNVLRAG